MTKEIIDQTLRQFSYVNNIIDLTSELNQTHYYHMFYELNI